MTSKLSLVTTQTPCASFSAVVPSSTYLSLASIPTYSTFKPHHPDPGLPHFPLTRFLTFGSSMIFQSSLV